jgi:putative ABC transport system substrate-binding protein
LKATARPLGFEIAKLEIRRAEDIATAFEALKGGADALMFAVTPLTNTNRVRINTLALAAATADNVRQQRVHRSGRLMSYGTNFPDLFRRAGDYVDKICAERSPATSRLSSPTKFESRRQSDDCQGARSRRARTDYSRAPTSS